MTINKTLNGTELTVNVAGRLDTTTAPELDASLKESYTGLTKLVLDFDGLDYVSSAGLRVILSAQKQMTKQGGELILTNVCDIIMDVLDVTGFLDIITVQK